MPQQSEAEQQTDAFYSDDIITLLRFDPNERYVPLRRLCEAIGLDASSQSRRIREHTILSDGLRTLSLPEVSGLRPVLCLRLDLVPLWLITVDARRVSATARERLELFQRESASILWQSARPQGFSSEDALLPPAHEQNAAEQAYQSAQAQANLARQQLQIERQIKLNGLRREDQRAALAAGPGIEDTAAVTLAQTVRRVATTLTARTYRNEYGGVYSGLNRQFSLSSYRRMPPARLREALEWLERWYGDMMGEPEPPPDI